MASLDYRKLDKNKLTLGISGQGNYLRISQYKSVGKKEDRIQSQDSVLKGVL